METKFNSQICTTREQSERLLALGLKKETADCRWTGVVKDSRGKDIPKNEQMWFLQLSESENYQTCGFSRTEFLPAWSLHRLIVLNLDTDLPSAYEGIEGQKNIYDEVIDYTEWLIKEGYFNKEYLV